MSKQLSLSARISAAVTALFVLIVAAGGPDAGLPDHGTSNPLFINFTISR